MPRLLGSKPTSFIPYFTRLTSARFREWGEGSLSRAWPILHELCPELAELSRLLNKNIIQPMRQGVPLTLAAVPKKTLTTWEFVEAVAQGNAAIENARASSDSEEGSDEDEVLEDVASGDDMEEDGMEEGGMEVEE